jgi:small conductance mechanosensitive channel
MQFNWDEILGYVIKYGITFLTAVVIFVVGKWVAQLVAQLSEQAMTRGKVNATLVSFAKNIIYYIILIFVALAALNQIGIQTNSFVAIIGAAGLAVGLALQGSLANFAAGVMIILFQPFEVGDRIDAGGASGKVKEIQVFSTIIITDDNLRVIVPNAKVTGDKIVVHPRKA